jgi:cardiolipin synthase A/B
MVTMTAASKIVSLPIGKSLLVDGNELTLLADCDARLGRYIALIEGAKKSVDIIIYVFEDDPVGRIVQRALLAAAARGVAVRIIVDSFGSGETADDFFAVMRDAGVSVEFFSRKWRSSYLIRNHQKLLIVDGEAVLVGGYNLSESYFDGCSVEGWSDLGIELHGGATAAMADWFERLYSFTQSSDGQWLRLRRMIRGWQAANPPNGAFAWLVGGPTQRLSPWARSIRTDLALGQRIDMVMAYFSPGQGMLRRLGRAGRRGQVRLITAARSDNGATIGAARLLYKYLLRKNISVMEYQPQRLHMKLVVVDDAVYVGSANFDMRSLFMNLEVMLRIEDAALAAQARDLVDHLAEQSETITPAWVKARATWLTRLRWILSWFVVSTLDYNVVRRLNFGLEIDPT